MLHLQTILHPTDFSSSAEHAFQVACSLARDQGARLIVLHVAVPPVVGYGSPTKPPPQGDWQALEEQLAKIEAPDVSFRVERQLEIGDPVSEIVRLAKEAKVDIIVMGSHGRTGLARLLIGSVAEHVVRDSPCAVLIVKNAELK